MYHVEYVEKPCHNFCILSCCSFIDPKDGVEKFAVVSFSNHVLGVLYLVEPRSNTAESYTLPLDNGAWALYNYQNEALIIGTCTQNGCVHRFDLATRTFAEPLQVMFNGDNYIWNFAFDGDHSLYCSTYSKAELLRYDLTAHKLENLGMLDPAHPGNKYNRTVAYYDGYILCDVGMETPCTFAYRISDGDVKPASECGITIKAEELLKPTDPRIKDRGVVFSDGSAVVIDGQEYLFYEGNSTEAKVCRIPGEPPATGLHALAADENGLLYGACNFGMTIFSYDPKTGTYWNSSSVDPTSGGEVYGMAIKDGKVYMSAYSGGRHIVYDPEKPWNSREGVNPYLLDSASPEYIRPYGRTVIGPNGDIWSGWYAKYGAYGGALSKIETQTGKVTVYPVGENGVASVTADEDAVYYITFGNACGLPYRMNTFKLAAVNANGEEIRAVEFPEGTRPGFVCLFGDRLYVSCHNVCKVYCRSRRPKRVRHG